MRLFHTSCLGPAMLVVAPALALALAPVVPQDDPVATVREPETEIDFPVELVVAVDEEEREIVHRLVATGAREKTIFAVNVYGFGFYLDAAAARPLLEPYLDKSVKELMKHEEFTARLLSDRFGKTMRLVMARDVDAEDMAEAFDDSLRPRVRRFHAESKPEALKASLAALDRFRGFFTDELEEGQELVFSWFPGGVLATEIDGEAQAEVEDLALARALFDVYLGPDPIVKAAKERVLGALAGVLEEDPEPGDSR